MPRRRGWSDLVPGVLALVALAAGAAAVLVYARVGALRGEKFRLYVTVAAARGLSPGSEVWLAGTRVGSVDAIDFLPAAAADTSQRLLLALDVLARYRAVIRRGAPARVEPGGNFIGAPVVAIALGHPGDPAVNPGDTLHAPPTTDVDRARAEFQLAAAGAPAIIGNLRVLGTQLRATTGTLGALGIDGRETVRRVAGHARSVMGAIEAGPGSVGRFVGTGDLLLHARRALDQADSVRALVSGPTSRTSLGRFRRDSTLLVEVDQIRADLAEVQRLLNEPRGTAGRLQQDSALVSQIAATRAELTALLADVKRNPLRYLAF